MKTKFIILCLSFWACSMLAHAQRTQEKDRTETIRIYVSEDTGDYYPFGFPRELLPVKGLKIKEGRKGKWFVIDLREIEGFEYKEGTRYTLKVKKTYLANPPADARSFRYALKRVIRKKVTDRPQ